MNDLAEFMTDQTEWVEPVFGDDGIAVTDHYRLSERDAERINRLFRIHYREMAAKDRDALVRRIWGRERI